MQDNLEFINNISLNQILYFVSKKEAFKLLTKSKYFSNFLTTIITNVLRTPKPYKTKAFKSICRLLVASPKHLKEF